jgi:hypothetical protein
VILVGMGDEDAAHWSLEIQRCRQQSGGIVRRVQGPADIQEDAMVARGDFDAITADLLCCAMDGKDNRHICLCRATSLKPSTISTRKPVPFSLSKCPFSLNDLSALS